MVVLVLCVHEGAIAFVQVVRRLNRRLPVHRGRAIQRQTAFGRADRVEVELVLLLEVRLKEDALMYPFLLGIMQEGLWGTAL